jgi:hypothetical protein
VSQDNISLPNGYRMRIGNGKCTTHFRETGQVVNVIANINNLFGIDIMIE